MPNRVKATYVEDKDDEWDDRQLELAPGSFTYYYDSMGQIGGMLYICPCGCKQEGALRFRNKEGKRPSWVWNGNKEYPTLTPSVHHVITLRDGSQKTHWHGHLTIGWWVPC